MVPQKRNTTVGEQINAKIAFELGSLLDTIPETNKEHRVFKRQEDSNVSSYERSDTGNTA